MICPVCKQLSTFVHFIERFEEYITPVMVKDGKAMVDFDDVKLNDDFDKFGDPNICVCEKCENDVQVSLIKVVHE